MSLILLLTATVTPNTSVNVSLADPEIRLAQYQAAIREWARTAEGLGASLRVVETSGCSPEALFARTDKGSLPSVSHVAFVPSEAQVLRGKGVMEWGAVEAALVGVSADTTVYKITGRLSVPNAHRVFGVLPDRAVRVRMRIDGSLADTRVIGARASAWDSVLLPAAVDVDMPRGIDIEQAVGANLIRRRNLGLVDVQPFPQRPFFVGESGYNGAKSVAWRTAVKNAILRPFEPLVAVAARSLGR